MIRVISYNRFTLIDLDGVVDMLLDMGIPDLPNGVNMTHGMCESERSSYQKHKAAAYAMNKGAMVTVATSEVKLLNHIYLIIVINNIINNSARRFSQTDSPLIFRSSLLSGQDRISHEFRCSQFTIQKVKRLLSCLLVRKLQSFIRTA